MIQFLLLVLVALAGAPCPCLLGRDVNPEPTKLGSVGDYAITTLTEVLLDDAPCALGAIPKGAEVVAVDLVSRGMWVKRLAFRSKKGD